MKGTDYYVISLKHTPRDAQFITLWRPDNAGYCWFKAHAGVYDGYEDGYHNHTPGNLPVRKVVADVVFSEVEYDGKTQQVILNTLHNRKCLGIRKVDLGKD